MALPTRILFAGSIGRAANREFSRGSRAVSRCDAWSHVVEMPIRRSRAGCCCVEWTKDHQPVARQLLPVRTGLAGGPKSDRFIPCAWRLVTGTLHQLVKCGHVGARAALDEIRLRLNHGELLGHGDITNWLMLMPSSLLMRSTPARMERGRRSGRCLTHSIFKGLKNEPGCSTRS